MNKLFTKIVGAALGLTMAIGVGVAVGNSREVVPVHAEDEVFYNLTPSVGKNSDYNKSGDVTVGSIAWNVNGNNTQTPWRIGGKSKKDTDRTVYSKTAMGSAINKVDLTVGNASSVTVNSLTLVVASDEAFSNELDSVSETFAANSTITFNPTSGSSWATGVYYKFVFNITITSSSNKFVAFSGAQFYREKSASTKYTVTYDLNGGSGTSDIPEDSTQYNSGATATVLGIGDVTKAGYSFINWSDGTNTYDEDDTFSITANTTLTAQWYLDDIISVVSGKESNTIYTDATLVLTSCVSAVGDGALSFSVPTVNYLTYDSDTYTITADSTNTGGPLTITANKGSQSCTFSVTVAARPLTGTFELFSGSFVEGTYVIASGTNALKAEISSKRGAYTTITPNANDEVVNPASDLIWEIEAATIGEKTGYTIYNSDAGYFSSTTANGNAALLETATSKSVWAASGDGSYEFVNQDPQTSTKANLRLNSGYGFACYATGTGSTLTLYKLPEAAKTITSSRMVNGTVSASTGDTEWTLSGFKFFVTYEGESETEVTDKTTFNVTEEVPTITADGSTNVTVTPTFKGVEYTAKASTVSATLTFVNLHLIERIYSLAANTSVEVDGVYMGLIPGNGYIFQNGHYGILLYNNRPVENTYNVGDYYTLSGETTIYNGLYELKNTTTVSPLSDATRVLLVGAPETYVVVGGEDDAKLANRKTSLSGVVTNRTATEAGKNDTVTVSINSQSVTMYIKAAGNTADVYSAISDSLNNETAITIEGFTSWYNGFQVQFANIVEADASYHAADFARDLLKQTMGTCNSSYDGVTNNASTLTGIWTTLAGADHWLKVEANGEEADFVDATPDSTIVVPTTTAEIDAMSDADALAAAAYRYDYCTAKYSLTNFTGRTLTVSFASRGIFDFVSNNTSTVTSVIIIISLVSLTAIGGYFFIRKRKEQ